MNNQKESAEPALPGFQRIGNQFIPEALIVPSHQIVPRADSVAPNYDLAQFVPSTVFEGGHFDSVAAERQEDALMQKRFSDWFLGRNTGEIPDDVGSWLFYKLTGYKVEIQKDQNFPSHTRQGIEQVALGTDYASSVLYSHKDSPQFELSAQSNGKRDGWTEESDSKPYFETWKPPVKSQLQLLIEKAKENPDALLMGGRITAFRENSGCI